MKILIIGGVAGGATAAARLRRLSEDAEIVVIERSGYVSYANCGLPYYIGGTIRSKDALTLQTPESFYERFRIDVRVREEAVKIDTAAKTVTIRRISDGTVYTEVYDKLILSPGAKAVIPDVPGVDSDRIFTLRTVEDTFQIRGFIENSRPKKAVVVGGGFRGFTSRFYSAAIRCSLRWITIWPVKFMGICACAASISVQNKRCRAMRRRRTAASKCS